jgi:hypothetical protein
MVEEGEMFGHVTRIGEMRNTYQDLVGKYEGKRPLGRTGHRWEIILKSILMKQGVRVWSGVL